MKEYTVDVAGLEHTMQLDDEDAKRLGATESSSSSKRKTTTENKSRASSNKAKG